MMTLIETTVYSRFKYKKKFIKKKLETAREQIEFTDQKLNVTFYCFQAHFRDWNIE